MYPHHAESIRNTTPYFAHMPEVQAPAPETVTAFYDPVKDFYPWPVPAIGWPAQFILDSELNWLPGPAPIDDLYATP